MERERDKARKEHACGTASGHKGRNLRHHRDVHAHKFIHVTCCKAQSFTPHMHRNLPTHTWLIVTNCSVTTHSPTNMQLRHSCYWLPVITSTLFPQAGTKNNSLLHCGEHCPSALIMGQRTSIWLLQLYHSRNLFTVEHFLSESLYQDSLHPILFSSINRHK